MKKTINAYAIPFLIIAGIIVTVIGSAVVFPNWDSYEDFKISFAKGEASKKSGYHSVNCQQAIVWQESGDYTCKYDIYAKKSCDRDYTEVAINLRYYNNNEVTGDIYTVPSSLVKDIHFKADKKAGTSVASKICISLGKS